ncbi:MAG: hypothetical protein R3C49_22140 [Planctomycetaceae bacterium]
MTPTLTISLFCRSVFPAAPGLILTAVAVLQSSTAFAQLDFEQAPIRYSESEATDRVHQLAKHLSEGTATLKWDNAHGYLRSVLKELDVPVSSQTLVFSKTSLQVSRISPRTPRAVYFNDDVYVGWVQQGEVIELSAADVRLGGTFYTLAQSEGTHPVPQRETSRCLQCHGSSHTRRVPGHIVRSVYPEPSGLPAFRLGTHLTDETSPFTERWGGWYVTGTHGDLRHMGNVFLVDPKDEELDVEDGANLTDLSARIDVSRYLSPHSDIVALLVLQHQVRMHNAITAANHAGRLTERDMEVMNRALERDPGYQSESTERRFQSAATKVVQSLLFQGELPLTSAITGSSPFADEFSQRGPFDDRNRSLRTFDLQTRLFRYPCSFLVYSDAFQQLPPEVMKRIEKQLSQVLNRPDSDDDYPHLSVDDRRAIREILQATTQLSLNPIP